MTRLPPALRRSWLFVPGADEAALAAAAQSGADVLIQELEDFTPPERRPQARALALGLYDRWRAAGAVAAVRVNPLEGDGVADLDAVMRGRPDVVLLPKTAEPAQVVALASAVTRLERALGIAEGATELVPNIEGARGVMQTYAIATASDRVTAIAGSTEDLAADLGAERTRAGAELAYARQRMLLECKAARLPAVDGPYTFTDAEGCEADARFARQLGYHAKSAVRAAHIAIVNRVMTPAPAEIAQAARIVAAFDAARASGADRVELDGRMIELPTCHNARRLLERARALGVG